MIKKLRKRICVIAAVGGVAVAACPAPAGAFSVHGGPYAAAAGVSSVHGGPYTAAAGVSSVHGGPYAEAAGVSSVHGGPYAAAAGVSSVHGGLPPTAPLATASLEAVASKAGQTGRNIAVSLIGLALAIAAVVLAFRRDFKEAVAVFAVGIVCVLFASSAGETLLQDTVKALVGA